MFKESFFNENMNEVSEKKLENFLIDPYSNLLKKFSYFSNENLQNGLLYKKIHNSQKLKKKYFKLYKDRIEVFDASSSNLINYYIMLKGVKALFFTNFNLRSDMKYSIVLTKNGLNYELFPCSKQEFKIWMEKLKSTCILEEFGKFYSNVRVLGQGSFAEVVLSFRNMDKKAFAVKKFQKSKLIESNSINKNRISIMNEIHILRIIDHPNIIQLYEVYEGKHRLYLVMEYLKGGELFQKLMIVKRFSESQTFQIMTQLISAVMKIHEVGILHRDIKPENIMLKSSDSLDVVLTDFGLAEFLTNEENLNRRCGTPGYIAPEVIMFENYTKKADVFSIGVVLLIGGSPFYAESVDEILYLNVSCKYLLDYPNLELSGIVKDLIKKTLEKEIEHRYSLLMIMNHSWMKSELIPDEILIDFGNSDDEATNLSNKVKKLDRLKTKFKFSEENENELQNFEYRRMKSKLISGYNLDKEHGLEYRKSYVFDSPEIEKILNKNKDRFKY